MIIGDPTPQEAADIVAISRLAVSYSEAICRGEIDEAVTVYTEDGVLCSAKSEDAIGHAAIAATIREATKAFEFTFQTTHSGLVKVDGDTAWARFPTTEWAKLHGGRALQFLGIYEDILRRTPEGWRFAKRKLQGLALGRVDSFADSRSHPLPPPTVPL